MVGDHALHWCRPVDATHTSALQMSAHWDNGHSGQSVQQSVVVLARWSGQGNSLLRQGQVLTAQQHNKHKTAILNLVMGSEGHAVSANGMLGQPVAVKMAKVPKAVSD
mmetsp:Transcript_53373/g.73978  ORF Transcript_53373/g.73978 Transcript_53373/m.73978 type:complete len:108 (+) Transcript_53373:329-652(+)